MTPEQKARQRIDQQLTECGWTVQGYADLDLRPYRARGKVRPR